ncbi:MAG: hypothetical protein F3740_09040 [Nitrospinae bacterium]|nr:hypothetical protein [Nitrospinota bacterium]
MRFYKRLSFVLIVFSFFYIILFRASAIAQDALPQISTLPQDASALTVKQEEQFLPTSRNILDEAILSQQEAEKFLLTAQTALDSATLTEQEAGQKLANAQAELELATAQQQAAEQAVRQEEEQLAAELARREAELATAEVQKQETDQQLSISIEAEAMAQQQLSAAQATLDAAKATRQAAEQASQQASALVQRIREEIRTGSAIPELSLTSNNSAPLTIEDWDCVSRDAYGGPGTVIDLPKYGRACVLIAIYDDGNEYNWGYLKNSTVQIRQEDQNGVKYQLGKDGGPYSGSRRIALYDAIEDYLEAGNEIVASNTGGGLNCKNQSIEPNAAGPRANVRYCYDSDIGLNGKRPLPVYHLVQGVGKRTLIEVDGSKELFSNLNKLGWYERQDLIKEEYQRRGGLF